MPDTSEVLGILKWLAVGLGAASAVWGLLARKPTIEDEHGRKRLTPSGLVTLAIALGATLISAMSYGFETLAKDGERALAFQRDNLAKITAATAGLAAAQSTIAASNSIALRAETRANAAEQRATDADDRARSAAADAKAQLRDFAIEQQVSAGAQRNLERTAVALTQLERVLQPLEALTVTATFEIPRDAPGQAAATARLATIVAQRQAGEQVAWDAIPHRGPQHFSPAEVEHIDFRDEAYPRQSNMAELLFFYQLQRAALTLTFFADGVPEDEAIRRLAASSKGLRSIGDLRLGFGTPMEPLEFLPQTGAVRFTVQATIAPDAMGRTGEIVSIPDLERSLPLMALVSVPKLLAGIQPVSLTIASASRTYEVPVDAMRAAKPWQLEAVFVLPRLSDPSRTVGKPAVTDAIRR